MHQRRKLDVTQQSKTRGIFERPLGSGIWWINYYVKGKQHREKVGRKSDATALYQKRKADYRRGMKLPELVPKKVTTFGELATDAVIYAKAHLRTWADYDWKERDLREPFGLREAVEINSTGDRQIPDRTLQDAGHCESVPRLLLSLLPARHGKREGCIEPGSAGSDAQGKQC